MTTWISITKIWSDKLFTIRLTQMSFSVVSLEHLNVWIFSVRSLGREWKGKVLSISLRTGKKIWPNISIRQNHGLKGREGDVTNLDTT